MATHTIHQHDLREGDLGVDDTVGLMCMLARKGATHPAVLKVAKGIDRSSQEKTLRGIFKAVLDRVKYKLDPTEEELVRAPWITLGGRNTEGDCDCMTVALASLCKAIGIPCWIKVIDWRDDVDEFTHVFLLAELKPGWAIPLDATMNVLGFGNERFPVKRKKEYKV